MILIVLAVLFLAAAAYLIGEAATAPARERHVSVKRAANYGKIRAALGAMLLGMVFGGAFAGGSAALLFGAGLGVLGFMAPDFIVGAKARKRRDQIRMQLPDV